MWTPPIASDFKAFFARDFYFAPDSNPDDLDLVTNNDINQAIAEAQVHFNTGLYGSDSNITTVFMYLAAFHLCRKIQVSTKGLASQSRFPINSYSVGGVSIGFTLPDTYSKDPFLSSLTANGYGMRFLEFTLPLLSGNVFVACGGPSQ